MHSLRTIIDKKFKKRSTLILVFLLALSINLFNSSLAIGDDTPACYLHKRLVNISSLEEARKLTFETTSKLTYSELLSFWEEGSRNKWVQVSEAARHEIAKRWSKQPEMQPVLQRVVDVKSDPSFRLELIDTIGHFKRSCTIEERIEALDTLQNIVGQSFDFTSVRLSACHRLAGLIRLMKEKQELSHNAYSETSSLLSAILLDDKQPAELRSKVATALGVIEDNKSETDLINLLNQWRNLDPTFVRGIIFGLGRLKSKEAIQNISEVLNETSELNLYSTASVALGMIGGTEVVAPLVKNRSRFPTPNCLSALKRNKQAIQSVLDGQASSCPQDVGLEALCLVANEKEWKVLLESLPDRDIASKKKILQMAVEVSPSINLISHILMQIKTQSKDVEMNRNIEFLLRRTGNLTKESVEIHNKNHVNDEIPAAPNE